jgi:predicted O-linked N-acetylglucosamine transferase (SPINDLY family)
MGVPLVTLAGEGHLRRTGITLLNAAGLSGWVAGSREEYIGLAVEKAGDLLGLREIRRGLRERMRGSPLGDARGYTVSLENAYRGMLESIQ